MASYSSTGFFALKIINCLLEHSKICVSWNENGSCYCSSWCVFALIGFVVAAALSSSSSSVPTARVVLQKTTHSLGPSPQGERVQICLPANELFRMVKACDDAEIRDSLGGRAGYQRFCLSKPVFAVFLLTWLLSTQFLPFQLIQLHFPKFREYSTEECVFSSES